MYLFLFLVRVLQIFESAFYKFWVRVLQILSPRFTSPRFTSPVQSSPVREIQYAVFSYFVVFMWPKCGLYGPLTHMTITIRYFTHRSTIHIFLVGGKEG